MKRRELFHTAAALGSAGMSTGMLVSQSDNVDAGLPAPLKIIDTNASLFHWPFRRLPLDDTEKLVKKYRVLGISEAWVGTFEAILHRDLASANSRLVTTCRQFTELVPIGSVNPTFPGWEEDLRRCIEDYKMLGVRLHPNYHGYSLDDVRLARLLVLVAGSNRFVQIVVAMEDTRTQHRLVQTADVDLTPLPDVLGKIPGARVQLLNYRPQSVQLKRLAQSPAVYFDTARVESTDGVASLLQQVPVNRCMFGTHAPLFIPEASLIRTSESELNGQQRSSLLAGSAAAFRASSLNDGR